MIVRSLFLYAAFGYSVATQGAAPLNAETLLLFGGAGHETYLGCLCGEYGADSIFNEFGRHGSRYSTESVSNHYGRFGSPYSQYSACNRYASDPPIIVTRDGQAVARLTLNAYTLGATKDVALLEWLEKTACEV